MQFLRIALGLSLSLSLVRVAIAVPPATIPIAETGTAISVRFENSHEQPEQSTIIVIKSAGKTHRIVANGNFRPFPTTVEEQRARGFWLDIPGLKIDPSHFCLSGQYTQEFQSRTLLFFIGEAAASDPAPVLVIGFTLNGMPYKVLERSQFDITSFEISDRTPLIVGKSTLSQVMAGDGGNGSKVPYATTYDPFSVYTIHSDTKATYSREKSRAYNKQHYVWAGPRSREDYAVVYNLPGHHQPFGADASSISTLISQGNK